MALSWPVKGPISQQFGSNPNSIQPNGHTGVDFAIAAGTPIYAADSGNIAFEGWASTLSASNPWWIAPAYAGIVTVINHNDGHMTLYGHMSGTVVNNGQFVEKGQLIGHSGNTGLSTGPHLHFEILGWPLQPHNGYYGRLSPVGRVSGYAQDGGSAPAPSPTPLKPNQRRVGSNAINQRAQPNTTSAIVRVIQPNTVETFDGYVVGEMFSGHDIWFKDAQGFVWSGAFADSSVGGLPNLTPAPALQGNQRKVNNGNVNQRALPNTGAAVVRVIAANTVETFTGYVKGQSVTVGNFTTDIWYKDADGYAWAGGFTPSDTSGLPDQTAASPVSPTLKPNQRLVGPVGAVQRDKPSRAGTVIRSIAGGTVETFTGFVRGESVTIGDTTTNVWYKDDAGFAWAGGFMSQDTAGLPDLTTPSAPTGATRTTVPEGVRVRSLPSLDSPVKLTLAGGLDVNVKGYVEGEVVIGSNIWYVVEAGYSHASGWTRLSTEGLQKLEISENPVVVNPGAYSFEPDFDFVEYRPANINNRQDGNFPANPEKIIPHQFDAKAKNPSIDGVIGHFETSRSNPTSAHFVVSKNRIVQMVSLKDRAFHAGSVGNNYIGIEIDPQEDDETVASVRKLIAALNQKYGKVFEYIRHRDVPGNSTACGVDIHLEKYALPVTPAPTPTPEPTPTPTPTPEPTPTPVPSPVPPTPAPAPPVDEEAVIDKFLQTLKKIYFSQK